MLVIYNGGRLDEACVGDLAVVEAEAAGVVGLVVWGIQESHTLRKQTAFGDYLVRCAADPSYTFRRHLRRIGGAIEE